MYRHIKLARFSHTLLNDQCAVLSILIYCNVHVLTDGMNACLKNKIHEEYLRYM